MDKYDVEQLLKILPKLIRENDTVKGAIISALSGIIATREDIQELIASMDRRSEALIASMDKRFEAVDKRFEAVDKRFEAVDKRFEAVINSIKSLKLAIARMESKEGILFHRTVLELMKETLKLENIDPAKIRREILSDPSGAIFFPGYSTDIDVLIENNNTYLIEVKSTAGTEDVVHFLQNVKLYKKNFKKVPTQLILIALRIHHAAYDLADLQKIRVIASDIL